MNGDEMTPERLDAILDGREPPADDTARDMLALAAALREAAPGAGADLRARVRALPQPQPVGRLRRLLKSGWRGRMLVAAPALSAVIAAVIAVGVINRSPGDEGTGADSSLATQAERQKAGPAVPATTPPTAGASTAAGVAADALAAPIPLHVAPATLDARLADVRELVIDAGGTLGDPDRQTAPPGALVSITVPSERSAEVFAAIADLGIEPGVDAFRALVPSQPQGGAAGAPGALTTVRVLLTEGP